MSNIRVNRIENGDGDGSVVFSRGLSISENYSIISDVVNVTGVATATTFVGDGFGLSNLPGISVSKGIALSLVV